MSAFITAKMKQLAPHVVTKREIIKGVPESWRRQYPDTEPTYGTRNRAVREKLEALDLETATAAEVAAAIGNDGWTRLACDICEQDREQVVSVPREYDGPIAVCQDCATGIAEMLAAHLANPAKRRAVG